MKNQSIFVNLKKLDILKPTITVYQFSKEIKMKTLASAVENEKPNWNMNLGVEHNRQLVVDEKCELMRIKQLALQIFP